MHVGMDSMHVGVECGRDVCDVGGCGCGCEGIRKNRSLEQHEDADAKLMFYSLLWWCYMLYSVFITNLQF